MLSARVLGSVPSLRTCVGLVVKLRAEATYRSCVPKRCVCVLRAGGTKVGKQSSLTSLSPERKSLMIDVMKDIFNSGSKPFILLGNAAFYSEKLCLLRLLEREGILLRAEGVTVGGSRRPAVNHSNSPTN